MRALWLQPDEAFLAERQRLGIDKKDELWDGVLHMVPTPSTRHELVAHQLLFALKPVVDRLGILIFSGTTGLYGSENNYRIPDVSIVRADQLSDRGMESALLVVEVLSPNDESRDKFPFFASRGVCEVWIVDPATRTCEMFQLVDGSYTPITDGRSRVLDIEFPL